MGRFPVLRSSLHTMQANKLSASVDHCIQHLSSYTTGVVLKHNNLSVNIIQSTYFIDSTSTKRATLFS